MNTVLFVFMCLLGFSLLVTAVVFLISYIGGIEVFSSTKSLIIFTALSFLVGLAVILISPFVL